MTIFPKNNLPTASLNWGREVEKSINNLESGFRTAEVNNVSRDAQLQASYKRLDRTITQLAATNAAVDEAQSDAITALQAANTANATATTANSRAIEALQDIIDLGSPGGPTINATNITAGTIDASQVNVTNLNADNITSGSINADRISGGTIDASEITVTNLSASSITSGSMSADRISGGVIDASDISGVNISGTNISGSTISGNTISGGTISGTTVTGTTISGGSVTGTTISGGTISGTNINGTNITGTSSVTGASISGGTISGAQVYTSNGAGLTADLVAGSVNLAAPGTSGSLAASSRFGMVLTSSNIVRVSAPSGIEGATSDFATILGGDISVSGGITRTALAGGTLTGASLTAGGSLVRTTSSARYKTDIENLDVDYDSIIALQPKRFKRIDEVEENPDTANVYPGFIAEDLAGTSLDIFTFKSKDADGNLVPEGIHYAELTAALVSAIKHQDGLIKDLTARLEALESR